MCTYLDVLHRYTLDEVADLNEILVAQRENERLAYESSEAAAKRG